jgi:hypothetical protein
MHNVKPEKLYFGKIFVFKQTPATPPPPVSFQFHAAAADKYTGVRL